MLGFAEYPFVIALVSGECTLKFKSSLCSHAARPAIVAGNPAEVQEVRVQEGCMVLLAPMPPEEG